MKFQYKIQDYQTRAVESVIDCFNGQPNITQPAYQLAPNMGDEGQGVLDSPAFRNNDIVLGAPKILENIRAVQHRQVLPQSNALTPPPACPINLDVEMETGTGKTYCYIKTIFEMNQKFGWTKFIIMVPSVAIREGVYQSLQDMGDHFQENYHKPAKFFIYNSKKLHELDAFSSNPDINIMIINMQAFNRDGKDTLLINEELDYFGTRRPMDVIAANKPILILDEPQKMEGEKTIAALKNFNPLFILRYSATHKTEYSKIHRLDALDAYQKKLVKKIRVSGVDVKNLRGASGYLYLDSITISKQNPVARMEIEVKQNNSIERKVFTINHGDDLYKRSKGLEVYKDFVVSDINTETKSVEFTNGKILKVHEPINDETETSVRRIQIKAAIKAHLAREQLLFHKGIKVLSLFFIDRVKNYKVYTKTGEEPGRYATIFEEEYQKAVDELKQNLFMQDDYKAYLERDAVRAIHNGYFSMDKKTSRIKDENTSDSKDVDAYDLILKKKKELLSLKEPIRFIFSHSALREGWDNPNVFVICTLKNSDSKILRRQEVGRGMRISLNQKGERQDDPETVHETNILTVVASESYIDFVTALQKDISESLSARPSVADKNYFKDKFMDVDGSKVLVTPEMAVGIEDYLLISQYVDRKRNITEKYRDARQSDDLEPLPDDLQAYKSQVFDLINSVYDGTKIEIEDTRNIKDNKLNIAKLESDEFKELWSRINKKAIYTVNFDSTDLIKTCIEKLNASLNVPALRYVVQSGEQASNISYNQINDWFGDPNETLAEADSDVVQLGGKYDIIDKITKGTDLNRDAVGKILRGLEPLRFSQFKTNPERFITEVISQINEHKRTIIINSLCYEMVAETYHDNIFIEGQYGQNFENSVGPLKDHIYEHAITDSPLERKFAKELDRQTEVLVYVKLPRAFTIPTPAGKYNPDWAIAFEKDKVKHVYFVAETKGSKSHANLRGNEKDKVDCAYKFFDAINKEIAPKGVKYDVVTSISSLMDSAGKKPTPPHTKNT